MTRDKNNPSEWELVYDSYDPKDEGVRESLCVLGNGYLTTRGASEESRADSIHYPATYLAGGYNRVKTNIKDHVIENEDLVNFPNWLTLNFRIGEDRWFSVDEVELLEYRQILDLKTGLLRREMTVRDEKKRETHITTRRFVSMNNKNILATEMVIKALNWNEEIEVISALDGRIENNGVARYEQLEKKHIKPVEERHIDPNTMMLKVHTNQSNIHMAQAARTLLFVNGHHPEKMTKGDYIEEGYVAKRYKIELQKKQSLRIEKIVSIFTSKDNAISECGLDACNLLKTETNYDELYEVHKIAWKHIWQRIGFDVNVSHKQCEVLQIIRLHLFHLLQSVSYNSYDIDIGVPPRGWHGEAYRGHILWDELFVLPVLDLKMPELVRSLLLYRYRRLRKATSLAKDAGYKGAMYPWQSGSNGREESQEIHLNPQSGRWIADNSNLQRHVNVAIAFNVWQYYEATEDIEFLSAYGAEMILEIARFWADITIFNSARDRYEIHGVMGPDEYHDGYPDREKPGLRNNAYTNVMVVWVFARALEALERIPSQRKHQLFEKLHLGEKEISKWDDIQKKMFIPFHNDGVISQFEGYEKLKELDWKHYKKKYGDIHRLDRILEAEGDTPNRYKVSKQADVLMLFYLLSAEELRKIFSDLGYELNKDTIHSTIEYYVNRTAHGSTLSRLVYAWILARSNREKSWDLFCEALMSDVVDIQGGTTEEGIHLGAMAGTVDMLQRCYLGIEFRGNILRFNPLLPKEINEMQTEIYYRGHTLFVKITQSMLIIEAKVTAVKPVRIAYCDREYTIAKGEKKEIKLQCAH